MDLFLGLYYGLLMFINYSVLRERGQKYKYKVRLLLVAFSYILTLTTLPITSRVFIGFNVPEDISLILSALLALPIAFGSANLILLAYRLGGPERS